MLTLNLLILLNSLINSNNLCVYSFIYLFIYFIIEAESHCVGQASFKLLGLRDPPASASRRAAIAGMCYSIQLSFIIFMYAIIFIIYKQGKFYFIFLHSYNFISFSVITKFWHFRPMLNSSDNSKPFFLIPDLRKKHSIFHH